jgi:hypothetical protein
MPIEGAETAPEYLRSGRREVAAVWRIAASWLRRHRRAVRSHVFSNFSASSEFTPLATAERLEPSID